MRAIPICRSRSPSLSDTHLLAYEAMFGREPNDCAIAAAG
jgi:hypothetical protein